MRIVSVNTEEVRSVIRQTLRNTVSYSLYLPMFELLVNLYVALA